MVRPATAEQQTKFLAGGIDTAPNWIMLATVHYKLDKPVVLFSMIEMVAPFRTGDVTRLPLNDQTWNIIGQFLSRGIVQELRIRLVDRCLYLPSTEHHFLIEKEDAIAGSSRIGERLISLTRRATEEVLRRV